MVELPAWLVSDNDEDYFQAAMKLIHEDAARQAIVDQLKATDVQAKLFQPSRPEDATDSWMPFGGPTRTTRRCKPIRST